MCRPASHRRGSDSGPLGLSRAIAEPGHRGGEASVAICTTSGWLTWAKQFGADRDPDATPLRPRA